MTATGRPLVPALPHGDPGDLGDLQRRVLHTVARCLAQVPEEGGTVPAARDPWAAERVADGLRVLLASLPTVTGAAAGSDPVDGTDPASLLGRAGEALDAVAEAARRASVAFSVVGQEVAAEIADSLMTVALALRMLVELGRRSSSC